MKKNAIKMTAGMLSHWLFCLALIALPFSFTSCGDDNESEEDETEYQTENDGSGTDDDEEEDASSGSTYVYDNEDEDVEVTWSTSDLVGEWVVCYNLYQEWTDGVLTGQWESDDQTYKYIFSSDGSCSFYAGGANLGYEWEGPYTTTWSMSGNVLYIAASSSYSYYTQYYITGLTSDTLCLAYSETYTEDGAACKFRDYFKLVNSGASSGSGTDDDSDDDDETVSSGVYYKGHYYVDLGLSVKWATCNIGASSPEDYGKYYAWGETYTRTNYRFVAYKQTMDITYDISGNSDYDAATENWGGSWRMPTKDEIEELLGNCTWTWTTENSIKGYLVMGDNGNTIFLPAAGYYMEETLCNAGSQGHYWSSTPDEEEGGTRPYLLYFKSTRHYTENTYLSYLGCSVRPVTE